MNYAVAVFLGAVIPVILEAATYSPDNREVIDMKAICSP